MDTVVQIYNIFNAFCGIMLEIFCDPGNLVLNHGAENETRNIFHLTFAFISRETKAFLEE